MKHTIDLGNLRRSGRSTIMLATLAGLTRPSCRTLYVAFNAGQAARARALSDHSFRCIGAEQFVQKLPMWLASTDALAVDDLGAWADAYRNEALALVDMRDTLQLVMKAW